MATDAVWRAVEALASGQMVVVTDAAGRDDEGDLVAAADCISDDQMAFMIRHTTGIVCAPMPPARADELRLPPMVASGNDAEYAQPTVSVNLAGAGVSAAARAATVRALADPRLSPDRLRRPGHVFPLRACSGGVLVRRGPAEAALDLLELAGRPRVGAISELVADNGEMMRGPALSRFVYEHRLPRVSIANLVSYRRRNEQQVEQVSSARLPTIFGEFRAMAFRHRVNRAEHLALVMGDVITQSQSAEGVLLGMHKECPIGDVFGCGRCHCGARLRESLDAISAAGCGVVVYLRGDTARGISLAGRTGACALQPGAESSSATTVSLSQADLDSYETGAQVAKALGIERVRLVASDSERCQALLNQSIDVIGRTEQVTV
ncbi:3,4-dihydroxy-2-butanone-4-phosphate synthase [Mycolicibacterium sp. CBM1]